MKRTRTFTSKKRRHFKAVNRSRGGLFESEHNYFDSYAAGSVSAVTTSWAGAEEDPTTLNTLFAPQEGNGIENRQFNKVLVKSLRIRGIITQPATSAAAAVTSPAYTRMVLYVDTQTNGTQAQAEQVLTDQSTTSLSATSYQNTANIGRFRVLKDKLFVFRRDAAANNAAATTVSTSGVRFPFKFNIKFRKPFYVRFNNTNGGTVADIIDNSFHLIMGSDASGVIHEYSCRTTFIG